MSDLPVIKAIYRRRSIREFTGQPVAMATLREIVKAGIQAPSGLNNQPWRFVLVTDGASKEQLADLTQYNHIVREAAGLIAVYLDQEAMYDATKDAQSAGACIQNMLLATEAYGLGAVWIGQILKNKAMVNEVFNLDDRYELMALLAIGQPAHHNQSSSRKGLEHFFLKAFPPFDEDAQ